MDIATAATFEVSDVVRAVRPLPEVPYQQAVECLLTPAEPEWSHWIHRWAQVAETATRSSPRPIEACSRRHARLLAGVPFHPVIAAAHRAFIDHRPLRLSPDVIWLMVCQAVANHVNAHAEELRPRFVRHEGTVEIHVRRDDFVKGSPENPWAEVLDEFSEKVRGHVGPAIDLFIPAFSTTGPAERAAAGVVLLDAVRSYFRYSTGSLCGIPEVTLEGTTGDWESLARRAEGFAEFGLGGWLEVLRPVLRQFVRASQGDVERSFWRSLYKFEEGSGSPWVTGWVLAFFPYLMDHRTGVASVPVPWYFEAGSRPLDWALYPGEDEIDVEDDDDDADDADDDDDDVLSRINFPPTVPSFPGGLSQAPFRWDYRDQVFAMEFLGGFVGVSQDRETLALRPEIGWAVRESGSPGVTAIGTRGR